jgi:tRNA(fMet)-specific endonuclease VapC
MLDTNAVSLLIKGHPAVTERVVAVPMTALCISAITQGELLFGLARRPEAKRLASAVREFLRRVDALPWDSVAAAQYGAVRARMEQSGRVLGAQDLLIAAHAICCSAILVTNDLAFGKVPDLKTEDWSAG